ncbi:hypothetical protein [Heyndrickxia camelliae]|uniref:Uncharacterized protein n=1 Tax=Heyndrickxia camelliae TaxID=1707093 RepID=A0A2N3LMG5_9BACI|nr:hypothetical protein [Heyndrickxia camelliae]PKR85796.1 hypothetical protein CWO92_05300 [Heyndrickxia camelliae]
MNHFDYNKCEDIIKLIEKHIEELKLVRNRIKRSINDSQYGKLTTKTKELESLLHDNDIKLMTLILLQEKMKEVIISKDKFQA